MSGQPSNALPVDKTPSGGSCSYALGTDRSLRQFAEQSDQATLHSKEVRLIVARESQRFGHGCDQGGQSVIDLAVGGKADELFYSARIIRKQHDGEFRASTGQRSHRGSPVASPKPGRRTEEEAHTGIVDHGVSLGRNHSRN